MPTETKFSTVYRFRPLYSFLFDQLSATKPDYQFGKSGWRIHPVTGKLTLHQGIDLRADFEPVYAVMDGNVEKAGYDNRSGFYIRLIHSPFVTTSYAHLSVIKVKDGDIIKAGDIIGISGNSGTTSGPHLHFRIHYSNTFIKK